MRKDVRYGRKSIESKRKTSDYRRKTSMKKAVRIIVIAATAVGATIGTIAVIRKIKANKADVL